MAKFCSQCGAQSDDNALVCASCGAQFGMVSGALDPSAPGGISTPGGLPIPKDKLKKYGIIGGAAVAAIIVLIIVINIISGMGYKGKAKKFMSALEDKDYDKLVDLVPDKMIKVSVASTMKYDTDIKESKAEKQVRDSLKSSYKSLYERTYGYLADELGRGFSSSYELIDVEDVDEDEIDDYNDLIEELAEKVEDDEIADALDGLEVTDAKEVTFEVNGSYKKDDESFEITLYMAKIGGSWTVVSWDVDK